LLGKGSGVLTIRDREVARRLPVQIPVTRQGRRRGDEGACACGGAYEEVFITTGGPEGDPALFAEHPLAVDGWRCRKCGEVSVPRFLEPDEVTELGKQGAEHVGAGRLDEAELSFRRVSNGWPGFAPARFDLAGVLMRRVEWEERGQARQHVIARLLDVVEGHLRAALGGKGMPLHVVVGMLVYVLLRREAEGAAREAIAEVAARDDLTDEDRAELPKIQAYAERRGDLYDVGVQILVRELTLAERDPEPIQGKARRLVLDGVALLERYLGLDPDNWRAHWLAGKGRARTGDPAGGLPSLERAHALEPIQAEICRDLALALLDLDRVADAIAPARAAYVTSHQDAGLASNYGLILLLAGDLDGAEVCVRDALVREPAGTIIRNLARLIEDVRAGRRPRPTSLKDLRPPR
jgi:tetratricopeptide (TPR) repeat protein